MMIVLNHKGHEVVTTDLRKKAMELFEEGYRFYENEGKGEKIELGDAVPAKKITDKMSLVAMRQLSGG